MKPEKKMYSEHHCEDLSNENELKAEYLQITTIAENQQEAEELIGFMTSKKAVACAQVQGPEEIPWDDSEGEWRCKFKTSKILYPNVKKQLTEFFEKDDYTIKAMPIVKGSDYFFQWLKKQLEIK